MPTIKDVLDNTDWAELAEQKLTLLYAIDEIANLDRGVRENDPLAGACQKLDGLTHFLDALQDAAESEGYPVVFPEGEDGNG